MNKLFFVVILFCSNICIANSKYAVSIVGRSDVVITTPTIYLADIGEIKGNDPLDETIIALKKIELGTAPLPGKTLSLTAEQILNKVKDAGVDLTKFGYSLPRLTNIKQASRALSKEEAKSVLETYALAQGDNYQIKELLFTESAEVYPGNVKVKVLNTSTPIRGKMQALFQVVNNSGAEVRVPATVMLDDFRELAVASRQLARGETIEASDVVMARMNISDLPAEVDLDKKDIVGLEASRSIKAGEPLYSGNLKVPPVVIVGSTVTVRYRAGYLEATASGTALDSGIIGTEIRVRNEQSKKIVKGKIIESGLVGVNP